MTDIREINAYVQIKTSNNEDIIALMLYEDPHIICVHNAFLIEEHYINGTISLNFSRYDAYCQEHTLYLNKDQIVYWNFASEYIIMYYMQFKEYLEKIGDIKLNLSLKNSTHSLEEYMNKKSNKKSKDSEIFLYPTSNTAH